ncbi:hypothetical protein [Actinomadura oligospora]|uniref:hypothetical protein n=1 Tax=Actinomadura oligospora TaxID=111804 RepID=UPI0012FBF563|nr:hypothetical protein [Actinomadura oligospora]
MTGARVERVALRLAVEVVQVAYEEAMRQHGVLGSTVALVSSSAHKNLGALDDAPGHEADLRDLEGLREAIASVAPRVKSSVRTGPDGRLLLHVNNPDVGGRFCEDVSVRDVRHYLWSWGDVIAPAISPSIAAGRIVHVLATTTPDRAHERTA